jgi:hypothetical protein
VAKRLSDDALAFTIAFRDYCRRWTTTAIAADWAGFGKATRAILARLRHRIDSEDHDLYPLVVRAGQKPRKLHVASAAAAA